VNQRGNFDVEALMFGLVVIAFIIVAFLNGGRSHDERMARLRACSYSDNVPACVQTVQAPGSK